MNQFLNERLKYILWLMACHTNPTILFPHWDNWCAFHPFTDTSHKFVGEINWLVRTAIILSHLDQLAAGLLWQLVHISGIGPTEFINALVIIAYCYHTHLFVFIHKGLYKCIFFNAHVLSFVYDQYRFAYFVWFHFSLINHLGSFCYDIFGIFKVSYPPQEVKTIGVECLYFNKVSSVAYQFHKSLFEFCSGCSWKR